MKIKWIGHACFVITSEQGVKVVTDPFQRDGNLKLTYPYPAVSADIVTMSHEHSDHSDASWVKGKSMVLKGKVDATEKDVSVQSLATWHDDVKGRDRGANTIFTFDIDGMKVCHLGDLGHRLSPDELRAIGKVDVLMIPVGGIFTIDTEGATQVWNDIKPHVAIPMHYKTEHCEWLKTTADDFIKGKKNAKKMDSDEVEITRQTMPPQGTVLVLKYAGQA